jgi:hypothetical protein
MFSMTKNMRLTALLALGVLIFAICGAARAQQANPKEMSPAEVAKEEAAINSELEAVAREIMELLQHPGFRGQLRGEINSAKTSENILVLDKFLEKVSKQKNAPPGLAKARAAFDNANKKLKNSKSWSVEGIDLYFPVKDHKAKWKGNEDLLVAYAPAMSEADIKQIVAFSVKDKKRVILDPKTPPTTPVLVVVPEEHETHEMADVQTRDALPPPEVQEIPEGNEFHEQEYGSTLTMLYLDIRIDGESWTRGDPEVYVMAGQICSGQPKGYYWNLSYVNDTKRWYTVNLPMSFNSNCSYETYYSVWERDGSVSYQYRFGGWTNYCKYQHPRLACSPYSGSTTQYIKMCAHKSDDAIHVPGVNSPYGAMVRKNLMPWNVNFYYYSGNSPGYWSDGRYARGYFRMSH